MWSLASSVQLYRLRFIGSGHSDHALDQAIDPCTLCPMPTRSQGATAEEVFSRTYSDILQHFTNGVECKELNELHENDGTAL
jgi:hypothetical protein